MAKANLKSDLKNTTTDNVVSLPTIRKSKATSPLVAAIERVCNSFRKSVESIRDNEAQVQKVMIDCLEHFGKHGDANPADRLVKGLLLINHPSSTASAREVMAHISANSPITWETKSPYKLVVLKDGMKGYKALDVAKAAEVAFNETPRAMRARAIGQAAQNQALKDADLTMVVKRAAGVVTFFNKMITGADDRKIKPGEDAKMVKFLKDLNQVVENYAPSAVVPIAPLKKKAA